MRTLSLILVVAVLLCVTNSRGQDPKKGDGVKGLAEVDRQIAAKEKELAELKAKADAIRYAITAPIDLTKVDRTIAKEPAYKTKPKYCLLVFGPKAKTRVWLVLDGDVLYVDRNGNGDLTDANERVELDVEATKKIKVAPGAYTGMNVFNIGEVQGVRLELHFWVRNKEFVPQDDFYKQILKERADNKWENASLMRISKDGSQAQNPVMFCQKP